MTFIFGVVGNSSFGHKVNASGEIFRLHLPIILIFKIDFDQLIEDLQDMIKLLNTTYPKDIIDEEDKKQWFLMRGN